MARKGRTRHDLPPLTNKALRLAYAAHHGQTDKSGQPYIFHPYHLAEQMDDEISGLRGAAARRGRGRRRDPCSAETGVPQRGHGRGAPAHPRKRGRTTLPMCGPSGRTPWRCGSSSPTSPTMRDESGLRAARTCRRKSWRSGGRSTPARGPSCSNERSGRREDSDAGRTYDPLPARQPGGAAAGLRRGFSLYRHARGV